MNNNNLTFSHESGDVSVVRVAGLRIGIIAPVGADWFYQPDGGMSANMSFRNRAEAEYWVRVSLTLNWREEERHAERPRLAAVH